MRPMAEFHRRRDGVLLFGLALLLLAGCDRTLRAAPDAGAVDKAFARFWNAPDTTAAAKAVKDVVDAGVSFDDARTRLKRGRAYSKSVPLGLNQLKHRTSDGLEHNYTIVIPQNYDPSRKYQVRVQLHGGVSRESTDTGRLGIDR